MASGHRDEVECDDVSFSLNPTTLRVPTTQAVPHNPFQDGFKLVKTTRGPSFPRISGACA